MSNVMYRFTDEISTQIEVLPGELVPIHGNPMPIFDDKNSFRLRIHGARIVISSSSMAAALNTHVFAGGDSPLKDISLRVENDRLKIKGNSTAKAISLSKWLELSVPREMDEFGLTPITSTYCICP